METSPAHQQNVFREVLARFDAGESEVTVEIDGVPVTYNKPIDQPVCPPGEHHFVFMNDEQNGYHAYQCDRCINGTLIDPTIQQVIDGKVSYIKK